MKELYRIKTTSLCNPTCIVKGDKYRFSVLTPEMIRLEYSENGNFVDQASQTVINRMFEPCVFQVIEKEDSLEIITEFIHLMYDKKAFSANGLSIQVKGNLTNYRSTWHYGDDLSKTHERLGGTARTLDSIDGEIPLEDGLMSKAGFSVIDDSKTLLIKDDGWLEPRPNNTIDLYFFGYGRNYLLCLKDFYQLCGKTPLLPRYALGNWWSRYYEYSEESYKELMNHFEEEQIPLSVAVIDMDWHLTNLDEKYGSGWTGYTWNKELFPDPKGFMDWLHKRGMRITLNVHPAEGIRAFEDGYQGMAEEMGVNIEKEEKINFDAADPKFMEAYFKYMHHPNEEDGVDFWWIDWQQGFSTKMEGLDPLWVLNHYHYLDSQRNGKRPMILSRYAGVGSHRYPLGFSGDTVISWESLDFQPYFTANASNIGYGWWSHDIGGHYFGKKDDEMATRWLQFGVFSPIMRLHSSKNEFNSKEPWRYNLISAEIMKKFLQLRHQLIPYLYTMNRYAHAEGLPLVQPMYYQNPNNEDAYHVPNEYYFGTQLIVCPITKPINKEVCLAKVKTWLPEGTYIDFFTGTVYKGNRKLTLYRDLDTIPVLAKAGAIVPMTEAKEAMSNITTNPKTLAIKIFAGADGQFELYEDDGETLDYQQNQYVTTLMELNWQKDCKFIIHSAKGYGVKGEGTKGEGTKEEGTKEGVTNGFVANGDVANVDGANGDSVKAGTKESLSLIPEEREYILEFIAFNDCNEIKVSCNNEEVQFTKTYDSKKNILTLKLAHCTTAEDIEVILFNAGEVAKNNVKDKVFEILDKIQTGFELKSDIYTIVTSDDKSEYKIANLQELEADSDLLGAVRELLLAE